MHTPAQPRVFHAEKHCLDSFLVAQRTVVGYCERVDDHPAHCDVGGAEKFRVGHRVTVHNDPGRMDAIRDGNRKLSLVVRTSVAKACFLTHQAS
jgi:hypothetical protein